MNCNKCLENSLSLVLSPSKQAWQAMSTQDRKFQINGQIIFALQGFGTKKKKKNLRS